MPVLRKQPQRETSKLRAETGWKLIFCLAPTRQAERRAGSAGRRRFSRRCWMGMWCSSINQRQSPAPRLGGPCGVEARPERRRTLGGAAQIQSAVLDGHVVLIDQPAAKPGAQAGAPLRAVAGRAVYEGAGEWLHLTLNPRVEDGAMQLSADKIDISQDSGDALAHGNVKATWSDTGKSGTGQPANEPSGSMSLGGQGPAQIGRA